MPERQSTWTRAVITGGAGFLGTHLCRSLLAAGAEVLCVDNFLTSSPANVHALRAEPGFTLHEADVAEGLEIDGDVDLIVHLASPASPVDYQRHPLATLDAGSRGTRNALELAARTGARFVLASTSEVYGDPAVSPQAEGYWGNVNPVGPRSVYDEAKRFAEAMTAAYRRVGRADTGIVRIFNTYGPGMRPDDGRVVPTFACQALRGLPLTVAGDGSQTRSLCHVDDTVAESSPSRAVTWPGRSTSAIRTRPPSCRSPSGSSGLSGSRSGIEHIPLPEDDPMIRCPDITLARNALGWQPRISWREGLTETLAWFSAQLDAGARGAGAGIMRVLGINAIFHDPAAALIVDGQIVAAAEEERFSRRKHGKRPVPFSAWELPEKSAAWCLESAGLKPADLDAVAYSYDPAQCRPADSLGLDDPWDHLRISYAELAPQFLAEALPGLDPSAVRYVRHHEAHAASAGLAAPFGDASVLVLRRARRSRLPPGRALRQRQARGPGQPVRCRTRSGCFTSRPPLTWDSFTPATSTR